MRNGSNPIRFRRGVPRLAAFSLLLAAVVLPSAFAHAEVWENVTVITKTEGEYFNVTVESVAGDSTSVILNDRGSRKMFSLSRISVILDHGGKDITAQVFPWLKASTEGVSVQDSAAVKQMPDTPFAPIVAPRKSKALPPSELVQLQYQEQETPERRFAVMFSGGAGYGIAGGDWFDGLTSGFSGGGTIRFSMSEKVFVGISYRRQQLGIEEAYERFCVNDTLGSHCSSIAWDLHLDEFYLVLGYMTRVSTPRSPFVYMDLGLGGIKHMVRATASSAHGTVSAEGDVTEFGILLDVGGVFPLSKEIGLNVEGDMRITGKNFFPIRSPQEVAGPMGGLFGLKIGIVIMLGGGQ